MHAKTVVLHSYFYSAVQYSQGTVKSRCNAVTGVQIHGLGKEELILMTEVMQNKKAADVEPVGQGASEQTGSLARDIYDQLRRDLESGNRLSGLIQNGTGDNAVKNGISRDGSHRSGASESAGGQAKPGGNREGQNESGSTERAVKTGSDKDIQRQTGQSSDVIRNEIKSNKADIMEGNDRASDKISKLKELNKIEMVNRPLKDGVFDLSTGDSLVRVGGREVLFMPNGDRLTVNGDGSYALKAKGAVEVKSSGDYTTITYPNGDSVSFSKNGVESVSRGRNIVAMVDHRPHKPEFNWDGPIKLEDLPHPKPDDRVKPEPLPWKLDK